MAWLLLIVEMLQQERKIKKEWQSHRGGTITGIIEKRLGSECRLELPLLQVYDQLVHGLIYSSEQSRTMSQCDADPRVFEILLSHSGGGDPGYLKMSDIASVPDEDGSTVSLRPFAFNLSQDVREQVQIDFENCILHIDRMID